MNSDTYLLSDMDFFTECDPTKLVISMENIVKFDSKLCRLDIDKFIHQMVDGLKYKVYCLNTPPEHLFYLIISYIDFQQQHLKAGTPLEMLPQLECLFQDHLGNLNKVYSS